MSEPQRFEAVWPVLDSRDLAHPQTLIDEALDDLRAVARRSQAVLVDAPVRAAIRPGREVPGSGGAQWVVHVVALAEAIPPRAYRQLRAVS